MSVNKAIILGNICSDIEVRYMPNGNAVANFSVATNEKWKDKNTGEMKEKAEFHKVVVFGATADKYLGKYGKKGQQVYVEGKIETRKWQDNNGTDRYTTEIKVDIGGKVELLGGRDNQSNQQQAPKQAPQAQTPVFDDGIGF